MSIIFEWLVYCMVWFSIYHSDNLAKSSCQTSWQ